MSDPGIDDVLGFWFGDLDDSGAADQAHQQRWWRKDPAFDREVRDRFGALHAHLMAGEHGDWLATPRGRLATIIALDQFSRNMFRDTGAMFSGDARALAVALDAIERGDDRTARIGERHFLYMPLMHAEDLGLQDRCVALFTAWRDTLSGSARAAIDQVVDFAEKHRAIVRRFGRFPHRNALLGRASTDEELAFLKEPGSSF